MRAIIVTALMLFMCTAGAQGITDAKQGEGGSAVQGSAGPSGSQDSTGGLETCAQPMAAVAVQEPQSYVMQALARYDLQSPAPLVRLLIQQSNCFIVVERGMALRNMQQERAFADSGQLREGSNIGGGQMVAADFVMTPSVVFSEKDAGKVGGAIGGLFGGKARVLGGIAGGLKFKEAQTSMLLVDARSGVQVAAAEGSTKKADLGIGILGGGGGIGGAIGGYGNTNEGKIIAASLVDNYNGIVKAVRGNPSLQRDVGSLADEAAAGGTTVAGTVFNAGDVVRPKIGNVKVHADPDSGSAVIATLGKGSEMIYLGEEQEGFLAVETSDGGGWIKKLLVTK